MAGGRAADALVDAGGRPLFVRRFGAGPRAVVFWHGLNALFCGEVVAEAAPGLAERLDATVLAFDAPGFGGSPAAPDAAALMPGALADAAAAALDALGVSRAVWLGQSWGATVGCHATARHPQRVAALVLLDAGYQRREPPSGGLPALEAAVRGDLATLRFASWDELETAARERGGLHRFTPALAAAIRAGAVKTPDGIRPIVDARTVAAAAWGVACEPPHETWAAIERAGTAVLLLAATEPPDDERDRQVAAFSAALPRAAVVPVRGTGHDVLADGGPSLVEEIAGWLLARQP